MTVPKLSVTDRYRLLELAITPSQVVPDGRLMWLNGRRIFAHAPIERLGFIPHGATGLMMSAKDFKEFASSPGDPRRRPAAPPDARLPPGPGGADQRAPAASPLTYKST